MNFHRRLVTPTLLSSLVAGSVSVAARASDADESGLRTTAQAELAAVTVDVDRANVMFSPADNGVGPSFTRIEQYQQEYLAGQQSIQDRKYGEALQHLRKADKIIRSQPDWTESQ
jgi:hypothetical protein